MYQPLFKPLQLHPLEDKGTFLGEPFWNEKFIHGMAFWCIFIAYILIPELLE